MRGAVELKLFSPFDFLSVLFVVLGAGHYMFACLRSYVDLSAALEGNVARRSQ